MARLLVIVVLLVSSALAQQNPEIFRALYFNSTASPERFPEVATVIARVTGTPQSSVEATATSVMLRGTAVRVGLAEWLFTNLDRSRSEQVQ